MNSLNLRVSTIKTAENVRKNAEIRTSMVELSPSVKGSKDILEKFLNANSIAGQISVIKDVYTSIAYSNEDKIEFLAELYFNSPLKHPVRSQCCKLIQHHSNNVLVTSKLNSAIASLLDENKNLETCSCERINFVVTSLSGCFENFRIAKESLRKYVKQVSNFLYDSVQKYLKHLSSVTSPSIKNELYLFIHNSVRIILLCIQEFSEEFKCSTLLNLTNLLKEMGVKIIRDIYMPMDVKTNIGILMAYIAHVIEKYDDWLNETINCKAVYSETYLNDCFLLCAGIGVINTLKLKYLETNLDTIYIIIGKICSIANQYSSEPGMLLAATRSLLQLSKILLSFNIEKKIDEIGYCCQLLLNYTFSYFDHHMDSMRHISKDLLRNILSICSKYKLNKLLDKIYKYCIEDEISLSVKCILISNIAKVCGTQELIEQRYKNIFEDFFTTTNFEKDIKVGNCFESLMTASYNKMDTRIWQNIYVDFLIRRINIVDEENKCIYQNLLDKCIKFAPEITEYLLNNQLEDLDLNIKLSILCTVRKNGLKSGSFNTLTHNIADLKKAFLSTSDDTKISALRLLAESHKSTEELTELECNYLLVYLKYNSNCQSPATRQKMLGLSVKALTRLDTNLKKVKKIGRHENEFRNLHFYFKFLKDLLELLTQNLFKGANFSRRFVSLELLRKTLEIIRDNDLYFTNFLPKGILNTIFSCLSDSYEINKAIALDILKIFVDVNYGQFIMHESLLKDLIVSVKPIDSISAAYYMEFYCYLFNVEEFVKFFKIEVDFIMPYYEPVKFCALKMVINILNFGLIIGKKSILIAAVTNPLYGCLLTIKHILSKLDFNMLSQEETWRYLISNIIKINKAATEIVAPIVNSSSPEGHFPNDFNDFPKAYIGEFDDNESSDLKSDKNQIGSEILQPTPQMVLICSWRTIKEVSLILGELSLRCAIKKYSVEHLDYLLTNDQILEIGNHFKLLLSETKHRGAFEQAYVGFTKLCSRLWRVEQPELNILPMAWLTELIDIISKNEKVNEKICATRRSAGIPFMVQALITSELQVGTTKALKKCMKSLFEICYSKEHSAESKTHSLNILRTLFRCTDLNEVCSEYIADGIICAIQGYDGSTWSERNSSTLLFAALIIRIFGVQRTKDAENLNIRNKMTGRIFFLRYPKLFDYFLTELKEANRRIENNEKCNKLHPLLLVLSRLYPSALEGTESHLKISMFIVFISPCSACRELQTRILIAKAIVAFVPFDLIEERIYTILSIIKIKFLSGNGLNSNYFHGLLLQILFILKPLKSKSSSLVVDIANDLVLYQRIFDLNPIIMRTICEIFCEILKSRDIYLMEPVTDLKLLKNSSKYLNPTYSNYYPIFRKSFCIFKLQIDILNYQELCAQQYWENHLNSIDQNGFLLETFENTETYLNVILMILFKNTTEFQETIKEFECHKCEIEFISSLSNEFIIDSAQYFKTSSLIESIIKRILDLSTKQSLNLPLAMKTFVILSRLNILQEFDLNELLDFSKKYPSDLQNSIALLINSYLAKNKANIITTAHSDVLQYLKTISQPWNDFYVRFTSSLILKQLFNIFIDNIKQKNENYISQFSAIVLYLLMDDDADVRENVSKFVLEFCPEYSSKYENIVSTFAQKIFIEQLTEMLATSSNYDIIFVRRIFYDIITILQGECHKDCKDENQDFEVFDKNDINIFAEPQKIVLDFSEIFFEKFRETF